MIRNLPLSFSILDQLRQKIHKLGFTALRKTKMNGNKKVDFIAGLTQASSEPQVNEVVDVNNLKRVRV